MICSRCYSYRDVADVVVVVVVVVDFAAVAAEINENIKDKIKKILIITNRYSLSIATFLQHNYSLSHMS